MPFLRTQRTIAFALAAAAFLSFASVRCRAQDALLMEEPYGIFGTLNPTGHEAVYFDRICAETPVKLRHCQPGEMGAVIARYGGINGYDWVAIPLIPYLYSVESAADVPTRVDRPTVLRMRDAYREAHLLDLGETVPRGGFFHGGWTELVGVAHERRIYALRFDTTEAQDNDFIAFMNDSRNRSHFGLLYNNCADFMRTVLNFYYPHNFRRGLFPDAGMTTPKQVAYKLVRYGKKHPELHLHVYEIPQIPGYRRHSSSNKDISESLITTAYAVPLAVLNPYLAGGLAVDYFARGRFHVLPRNPEKLAPESLAALTTPGGAEQNPDSARAQDHSAAAGGITDSVAPVPANSALKEITDEHE